MFNTKTAFFTFFCAMGCMALSESEPKPKSPMSLSLKPKKSLPPIHGEAFLTGLVADNYSYLMGCSVWQNSWEWATFTTEDRLATHGTPSAVVSIQQFELILNDNKTVSIKCLNGHSSLLSHKPMSPNSWQWAFFASEGYLAKNPSYISEFKLMSNPDGSFSIQSEGLAPSLLAFDSRGKDYAFFATQNYLDTSDQDFSTSFKLSTEALRQLGFPDV